MCIRDRDGCPYTLLKLIAYYPQPPNSMDAPLRGVAPHHDYSLLTLLSQDNVGGLQVLHPRIANRWDDVIPVPNSLFVNAGELLAIATRGLIRAAPHRVTNLSR